MRHNNNLSLADAPVSPNGDVKDYQLRSHVVVHDFAGRPYAMQLSLSESVVGVTGGDFSDCNQQATMKHSTLADGYPSALIGFFSLGLFAVVLGAVLFVGGAITTNYIVRLAATFMLAAGAITVALTVIRGEQLDERSSP